MKTIYSGVRMDIFQKMPSNAHCRYAKIMSIYCFADIRKHILKIFSFPKQQSFSVLTHLISSSKNFFKELHNYLNVAHCYFSIFFIARQIIIYILQWLLNNWLLSRNSCKGYNFSISVY